MSRIPGRRRAGESPAEQTHADPLSESNIYGALRRDRPISGFAVVPLRLFLGITFIYAALQKITDPGFFHAGSPTYIGSQILAFSRGSPLQALLHHLMEFAIPVGVATVLTEGTIGLLVLLGLLTRPAALVGLMLSMGFFLTASWQTYPYFFGSDIVFVMCWLTLAITGPGVFALDAIVEAPLTQAIMARSGDRLPPALLSALTGWGTLVRPTVEREQTEAGPKLGPSALAPQPARRVLTRAEALVGTVATLGLVALGLHPRTGIGSGPTAQLAGSQKGTPATQSATPAPGAAAARSNGSSPIPAGARKIGNIRQLAANSAGTVSDPKTGDPAIIVRTTDSKFYAFDAVCTHAGCTVQYDSQLHMLVCPCHGGTFDPAHGAQVVAGPPPSPLTAIDMTIDSHGDIYIV